jgi:hypothetical protein
VDIDGRFELPDLFVYVGAKTEEVAQHVVAEVEKIVRGGDAKIRKGAGFMIIPREIEDLVGVLRGKSAETDKDIDEMDVFIMVGVRASDAKARWVAENIRDAMEPGKLDPYFLQLRAGWSSKGMSDVVMRQMVEKERRNERELQARKVAGPC